MTEPTQIPAEGKEEKYAIRYTQKETNYTPDYQGEAGRCAGCRWFNAHSDYDGCAIIQNYPLDVLPTGRCDKWEAIPSPEPDTSNPLPVLIVGEASADDKAHEPPNVPEVRIPEGLTRAGLRAEFNRMMQDFLSAVIGRKEPQFSSIKIKGNHWLITWSNNFEDREGEIFTLKAIDRYVKRVSTGIVEPPELWVWHAGKNTRIGKADWVARQGHFVCAAGQFDDTPRAQRAKAYYKRNAHKTRVSHGYTFPESAFDGKCYHDFNAFEISPLPSGVEANSFTSLERIKAMAFSDAQEKYLVEVFGEEEVKQIKASYEERGKALEELGVQFKDYAADDESAASKAATTIEGNLKALIPLLMHDNAEAVKMMGQIGKAFKDVELKLDTALGEIAALQEAYGLRPKSAVRGEAEAASEDDPLAKKAAEVQRDESLDKMFPGLIKPT